MSISTEGADAGFTKSGDSTEGADAGFTKSGDSTEGADAGFTKSGDSTECSRPLKKPKTDPVAEAEVQPEIRILRIGNSKDPEYVRQRDMYMEQFEKSEGYDVDWDNLDFYFAAVKFEWGGEFDVVMSDKELMDMLIKTAIEEENEESGTNLEFVKYVSANVLGVQGFLFFITFWAKDVSSPDPEPKLYQAKVRKFMDEILVSDFRLRPTQEPFV